MKRPSIFGGITVIVAALVMLVVMFWPRGIEVFTGQVAIIQPDRSAVCIHPDDNSQARCGVAYEPLDANIQPPGRVTVRVLTIDKNEVFVLTPRF
jgi:hypothetical protein